MAVTRIIIFTIFVISNINSITILLPVMGLILGIFGLLQGFKRELYRIKETQQLDMFFNQMIFLLSLSIIIESMIDASSSFIQLCMIISAPILFRISIEEEKNKNTPNFFSDLCFSNRSLKQTDVSRIVSSLIRSISYDFPNFALNPLSLFLEEISTEHIKNCKRGNCFCSEVEVENKNWEEMIGEKQRILFLQSFITELLNQEREKMRKQNKNSQELTNLDFLFANFVIEVSKSRVIGIVHLYRLGFERKLMFNENIYLKKLQRNLDKYFPEETRQANLLSDSQYFDKKLLKLYLLYQSAINEKINLMNIINNDFINLKNVQKQSHLLLGYKRESTVLINELIKISSHNPIICNIIEGFSLNFSFGMQKKKANQKHYSFYKNTLVPNSFKNYFMENESDFKQKQFEIHSINNYYDHTCTLQMGIIGKNLGKVLKAQNQFYEMFGFNEKTCYEINQILPPSISKCHNYILEQYIDSLDSTGSRKDGKKFNLLLAQNQSGWGIPIQMHFQVIQTFQEQEVKFIAVINQIISQNMYVMGDGQSSQIMLSQQSFFNSFFKEAQQNNILITKIHLNQIIPFLLNIENSHQKKNQVYFSTMFIPKSFDNRLIQYLKSPLDNQILQSYFNNISLNTHDIYSIQFRLHYSQNKLLNHFFLEIEQHHKLDQAFEIVNQLLNFQSQMKTDKTKLIEFPQDFFRDEENCSSQGLLVKTSILDTLSKSRQQQSAQINQYLSKTQKVISSQTYKVNTMNSQKQQDKDSSYEKIGSKNQQDNSYVYEDIPIEQLSPRILDTTERIYTKRMSEDPTTCIKSLDGEMGESQLRLLKQIDFRNQILQIDSKNKDIQKMRKSLQSEETSRTSEGNYVKMKTKVEKEKHKDQSNPMNKIKLQINSTFIQNKESGDIFSQEDYINSEEKLNNKTKTSLFKKKQNVQQAPSHQSSQYAENRSKQDFSLQLLALKRPQTIFTLKYFGLICATCLIGVSIFSFFEQTIYFELGKQHFKNIAWPMELRTSITLPYYYSQYKQFYLNEIFSTQSDYLWKEFYEKNVQRILNLDNQFNKLYQYFLDSDQSSFPYFKNLTDFKFQYVNMIDFTVYNTIKTINVTSSFQYFVPFWYSNFRRYISIDSKLVPTINEDAITSLDFNAVTPLINQLLTDISTESISTLQIIQDQVKYTMIINFILSAMMVLTIFPVFIKTQYFNEETLKLFSTFSPEIISYISTNLEFSSEKIRIMNNKFRNFLPSQFNQKQQENSSKLLRLQQFKKKKIISSTTNLPKCTLSLIILSIFTLIILSVQPIVNTILIQSLTSEQSINIKLMRAIYDMKAQVTSNLYLNMGNILERMCPNCQFYDRKYFKVRIPILFSKNQDKLTLLYSTFQNSTGTSRYNKDLYDKFLFQIMEGNICDALDNFPKYIQDPYFYLDLNACKTYENGILQRGFQVSIKYILEIFPNLFPITQQTDLEKAQMDITSWVNQRNLIQFDQFSDILLTSITSMKNFMMSMSDDYLNHVTLIEMYLLIFYFISIFLIVYLAGIKFYQNMMDTLYEVQELLSLMDVNTLFQNIYIYNYLHQKKV